MSHGWAAAAPAAPSAGGGAAALEGKPHARRSARLAATGAPRPALGGAGDRRKRSPAAQAVTARAARDVPRFRDPVQWTRA
jgi:hypothetical protein